MSVLVADSGHFWSTLEFRLLTKSDDTTQNCWHFVFKTKRCLWFRACNYFSSVSNMSALPSYMWATNSHSKTHMQTHVLANSMQRCWVCFMMMNWVFWWRCLVNTCTDKFSVQSSLCIFIFTIWFLCQQYNVKLVYLTFFLLHSNILLFTEMFQEIAWLQGSQVMYVLVIATVGRSWAISKKVKDLLSNWLLFFSKLL
jgi:hypothetical protein